MNFCKKAVSWLLAFGLILGSANMTVQAEETTQYSHGTVGITSDAADSTNVISLKKGETATVSISPYIHVQYKGCGKEKCPASCEEEYGVPCFEVGNGCKCDQTPTTRTAEVAATAADPAVAAVSTEVAAQTAGETVGSQAAGSLTITAQTAGETTVAVSAKLQDWVTAEVVYTVKVTEEEVKAEIPELVEGYYQIDSEQDLKWFAEQVNSDNTVNNSLNAQITADITLTEAYVPIAPSKAHTYSGTIDGNGHTITFANGIAAKTTINDKSVTITCEGLVGNAAGATIKNLTIAGTIDVTASKNYAAAFVGVVTGSSVNVTNCINKANITDSVLASTTGGIVGYALSSDVNISNCINYGNITTNAVSKSLAYTGGILGKGSSSLINITNCGNEGTVSSTTQAHVGGIIGNATGTAAKPTTITGCYNAGAISSVTLASGITTQLMYGTLENCYNVGSVSSNATSTSIYIGGLIGATSYSTMKNCYNAGAVTTGVMPEGAQVGAITGKISSKDAVKTVVENCYYLENSYAAAYGKIDEVSDTSLINISAKTDNELKNLDGTIGENFETPAEGVNSGYPVLTWQNVGAPKITPTLADSVTLRYTGDPLSIKVTDGTDNWAKKVTSVTIIDANGNEKVLSANQYEVSAGTVKLIRTAEDPIMSVSTAERTAQYTIKIEAKGYETLEETLTATMFGAKSFQVRVLDSAGNVQKSKTFTMEDMVALSDRSDAYYNTICGMTGIRTFKANGVSLAKLLDEAGIKFGEGMTLKLRTNDSAKTENDSTTENAYFRMGTFTYEDLMGQDRYYFPDIFTDENLKNTLLSGANLGEEVRTALAASTKQKVEPMLATNYVEKVYKSSNGAGLTEEAYNSLVGEENAFRFLFGIAMDSENKTMISGTTTTWSASFTVFGVDIIDSGYDETVSVIDYEARTDHIKSADYVSGDDTQKLYVDLTFAEPMKIVDKDALVKELTLTLGGGALSAERNVDLDVELSKDGKTLKITASGWYAAYSGKFASVGKLSNLVSAEGGKYANADASFYVPNGLETVIQKQVMADEETKASVTTQIVAPAHTTRGMVHLMLLKNGQPVGELNGNGATVTSHFHAYMTMTAADFTKNAAAALQSAVGEGYTVTAEEDIITITAAESEPGDVLEFHIVSYLNTNNQNVDKTELETMLKEIENMDLSVYTEESAAALKNQAAIAKVDLTSTYYAQTDIDQAVERLQTAKDALVKKTETDNSGNTDKPGTGNTDKPSTDNTGKPGQTGKTDSTKNPTKTGTVKTGDTVNFLVFVFAMVSAVVAGGAVVIDMKKRRR